ncbi:uncharacterized protein EDB91DRAFT_1336322 [Suillus paluster]|uniref:uncharacterized protein n=1 Tax=Suillus paluster TaxID=48578 RepID=UPI001B8687EF|nr:uncharacterized protein EDB91DRAFT_1336322 [Suillus paluster]KAG1741496.1 hypothetical protein EDB91DRAFT_1336322 [Suillus paluster]
MYSKIISVALVFTAALVPTGAIDFRRYNENLHYKARNAPPSTAAQVSCDGFQPWQANLAYNGGSSVIFNNQLWTAKEWSYNNNPESSAAQWTQKGCCIQPISNKAVCTDIPTWGKGTNYSGGAKVTYNGHLWISTQSTQSNSPGDTSGTWKDLGACE